jgi:amidase
MIGRMGADDGLPLVSATATELAALVRDRRASAAEIVEAHLRWIERVDRDVNAVVALDAERALDAARAVDAGVARGEEPGPLGGVPFTAKDNLEASGLEMAIGVRERVGVVPDRDATAVARMRAAGAILLGKTNCPPWGGGLETDNEVHGRTNNPYDLARTPGGSSGGEAAIVAACGSAVGLGTDSGASVRVPAHFCGLAAIKPTAGRVPITGVVDDVGPLGALSDPRTQLGVLVRSVGDVAAVLVVIAGPDGHDGGAPPVRLGDPSAVTLRGLRVAVQVDNGLDTPTADTVRIVGEAAAVLEGCGAVVRAAPHPEGGHELTIDVWRSYGGGMRSDDLYRLLRRWDAFRSAMLAFLAHHDLILCPVFAGPAPLHGTTAPPGRRDPSSHTTPHSLTGWPAVTVRCGTSADGLPIGVQIVAGPWREDRALAAARALERELGGYRPPDLVR